MLKLLAYPLFSVAVLLAGCGDHEDQTPEAQLRESLDEAEVSLDTMRERGEELAEDIREKTQRVRDLTEKQLALLDEQIDEYEVAVRELRAERERELRPMLDSLRQKRDSAEGLLREFIAASSDELDEVKQRLDEAMNDLNTSFEAFEERLRDTGD